MFEGEDWNEMDNLEETFPEYDNLEIEDLDTTIGELRERLQTDDDPLITERITYIDNLLDTRGRETETETDFGGVRSEVVIQIDKYIL